jgi:choline dehydrogenase-like flavoprotein
LTKQLWAHFASGTQAIQQLHGGYWESNPKFFVDDSEHPYSTPADKPYYWIRGRQVGGRSLTWGGVTLRFSDYEFEASRRDGVGACWPIGTKDLAPHYGMLERLLGSHGARDGIGALPDGEYVGARQMTPGEAFFQQALERTRAAPRVIISRGIRARRRPEKSEEHSRLSSTATSLAAAQRTGNLTLQPDAVVASVTVDLGTGRATGVEYVDRKTRQVRSARARIVFLCASALESVRLLMNSKSGRHPEGIGASSGVLGRYLMDHIVSNAFFTLPEVPDDARTTYDLTGADSIIVPRWVNLDDTREAYLRGFGMWGAIQRLPVPGGLRKRKGVAFGFLCGMGEALPSGENHMTIDPDLKDAWGIPAPHISCAWTENDLKVARAIQQAQREMVETAGGEMSKFTELVHTPLIGRFMKRVDREWERTTPGLFVHEVGGARMGTDPRDSVTNPYCQVWDSPNVFVTDGACWVSSGWQNPTLTEMAITARAAEHAVAELKRRNL